MDSEIESMSPASPALQVDSLPLSHQGSPDELFRKNHCCNGCRNFNLSIVCKCALSHKSSHHLCLCEPVLGFAALSTLLLPV